MAKKAEIDLAEVSTDDLLEELKARLAAKGGKAGKKDKEADADGDAFPEPDKIEEMDTDALDELCEKVGIDTEDLDDKEKAALLKTFYYIGADETDDLEKDDVKALVLSLGLKPTKDMDENVEAVKEFIKEAGGGEAEADAEAEDEGDKKKKGKKDKDEDGDEDGDDKKKKKSKKEIDPEEVAAEAELPKKKVMLKHLEAYNEAADKKSKIEVDEDDDDAIETAYRELLVLLVGDDGELHEWGEPYPKDGEGFCCGLQMEDVKIKGKKGEFAKCLVTETIYTLDDGAFVEVEEDGDND